MAFLDNSGDIILDAVLTDEGRKKMAQGNFKITKFALGDDEIDYGLYNKNNPSGSAYYDLEILQTPIFEAFTARNANINYGLLKTSNTLLLYLPTMVQNQKSRMLDALAVGTSGSTGVINLAVNGQTATIISDNVSTAVLGSGSPLNSGASSTKYILLETGLDTSELRGTAANRNSYLINNNLIDSELNISADSRFLTTVLTNGRGRAIRFHTDGTGEPLINFGTLVAAAATTEYVGLENYLTSKMVPVQDTVYYDAGASTVDTTISAIQGPRGVAAAINFTVDTALASESTGTRDTKWNNFGKLDQDLFNISQRFDTIDTTVYVEGATTSATIQLPIRLLRYSS